MTKYEVVTVVKDLEMAYVVMDAIRKAVVPGEVKEYRILVSEESWKEKCDC